MCPGGTFVNFNCLHGMIINFNLSKGAWDLGRFVLEGLRRKQFTCPMGYNSGTNESCGA